MKTRISALLIVVLAALTSPRVVSAQASGTVLPATCSVGQNFVYTNTAPPVTALCAATTPPTWIFAPIAVSGTVLPPICIQGALFTLLPVGVVYVCSGPNHWNQADGEKVITGMQNNVFTTVLTITIPFEAVSGMIEVVLVGALGAGGAVGSHEASTGRTLLVTFTRTASLGVVAEIVIETNGTDARVPGGSAITQATQLTAVVGAPTGLQTFELQYRLAHVTGGSNNHVAVAKYRLVSDDGPALTIQ